MTDPAPHSTDPHGDEARRRDVEQARTILRGTWAEPTVMFDLARRLKELNEFGFARRLFGRIHAQGDYRGIGKAPDPEVAAQNAAIKVGQQLALCTYKDPDLPVGDRFSLALEQLDEVDRLRMDVAQRQESLGMRGAIYKRKWQLEGQRADLVRARGYYLQGHALGPATDRGYNGINAAYVLDLMARAEAADATQTGGGWQLTDALWRQARDIRSQIADLLPSLPGQKGGEWLASEWWFNATIAEALLGLGRFDEALATLRTFNEAVGLALGALPTGKPPAWEFESTLTQMASLAQTQAQLQAYLAAASGWQAPPDVNPSTYRADAEGMLRQYLGNHVAALDRAFKGKLGLGLSGGGFRASLFHIGVLACLAENDVLRRVELLSCVSGGSILGAHYYLELQHLLATKPDAGITTQDYVELVERVAHDFLAGVQTNIRGHTFGSIWANLRMFFQPGYTTSRRLGELYEEKIYSRIQDGRGKAPRRLRDLIVRPCGEDGFKPKYDNWRRSAKVPELVLNASTLNTGHVWQFTASWMGEPPSRLEAEIGGNYRLRRMYHDEAPRLLDKWKQPWLRPFAPPDYQNLRLGHAVAASSCVPGLFEPLVFPDLYEGKTVRLVDGGVCDNQGIASLLEQDCRQIILSDASGQMDAQDQPSGSKLGVPLRSFSLSMARVRQIQMQDLGARRRSGLLRGMMFLHLRKDLEAHPVDWRECQDPFDATDATRPAEQCGVLTRFGVQKSVQRLLSAIRTDLDSFTEVEAHALMANGYRQARLELGQLPETPAPASSRLWRFLEIEPALAPGPGYDDLQKQLQVGSNVFFKVWLLYTPLKLLGALCLLLALLGLAVAWWTYRDHVLLTVYTVGALLAGLVATIVAPHLMRLIRYQKTVADVGLRALGSAVLALAFKVHLVVFDPLFLRLGRTAVLLKRRSP
jgi:predicted acylesterase/phospholipase RssA